MFIGRPVLIVVDIQRGYGMSAEEMGITLMNGASQMISRAERVVEAARDAANRQMCTIRAGCR